MVKQTSVNIKTDFNYPNALRPDTNPGYKTKYDRKNNCYQQLRLAAMLADE